MFEITFVNDLKDHRNNNYIIKINHQFELLHKKKV